MTIIPDGGCAIRVDIHADGTWSHEQDTLLIIPGQTEPVHHTDRNRLRKIAEPTFLFPYCARDEDCRRDQGVTDV